MRTGRSGEDRALGGRGRRLNELRGTLTPSLTEKRILPERLTKRRILYVSGHLDCAFP